MSGTGEKHKPSRNGNTEMHFYERQVQDPQQTAVSPLQIHTRASGFSAYLVPHDPQTIAVPILALKTSKWQRTMVLMSGSHCWPCTPAPKDTGSSQERRGHSTSLP